MKEAFHKYTNHSQPKSNVTKLENNAKKSKPKKRKTHCLHSSASTPHYENIMILINTCSLCLLLLQQ